MVAAGKRELFLDLVALVGRIGEYQNHPPERSGSTGRSLPDNLRQAATSRMEIQQLVPRRSKALQTSSAWACDPRSHS